MVPTMSEEEIKRMRQEGHRLIAAAIAQSSGDLREALILFRDESDQCEFWLTEAIALADAIGAALKTMPDGPARDGLTAALTESRDRVSAHVKDKN